MKQKKQAVWINNYHIELRKRKWNRSWPRAFVSIWKMSIVVL